MRTSQPPLDAARAASAQGSAVRTMLTYGTARESELGFAWARTPLAATARAALQPLVIPMLHALYAVDVDGMERLDDLRGGAIFTANHHHHLDAAQIVAAMPAAWRRRLLVVAAADTIFASPLRGAISALLGNAIPLERDGSVRHSLEHLAELLAAGWSLLIFPEGRLTAGGPLRHFKGGTALLALLSEAQVVPLWLGLERPGLWEGRAGRGRMRLRMGAPQTLSPDLGHDEAADCLEAAVRALKIPVRG